MVEGFWEGLKGHLFNWFSLVFTVGGTFISLLVVREYWWISLLFVTASYLALGTFAYRRHCELLRARSNREAEQQRWQTERVEASQKVREAERKLNEVPADILIDIQRVIAAHSFAELVRILVARADFVGRMTRFTQGSTKPINLRTFTKQGGKLYALAKVEAEAITHVRVGDAFVLVRRATNGLETPSARLVVHQLPDAGKDILIFHIAGFLSDELGHIDHLTQSGDVEGMKGYRVQVACDVTRYQDLDTSNLAAAIERLVNELAPIRRGADD